ncbi:MAG TPA: rod shape-determining protein MreD [Candidatus Mediterraneibacter quadrami]|uniref:Rod shape-determining protein MreD n=1 Tax=Candidatus Mediterraneibacter quadrami TaxID=2838684 RepID=A0A9D2U5N9_9FIRM|nr:rod shape-determining protein MreD [Candidatus Mediterraneibacter quadrami]
MKSMKIRRIIVTAVILLAAYLLQTAMFPALEIAGVKPNFMLIVTASFGFMRGSREGMLVGFVSGLMIDIQSGDMIGYYALIYLAAGYLNGIFEQIYFDEDIKLPLFLIAGSDLLYGMTIYFLSFLLRSDFNFLYYMNRIIIPETIYTIVITLIVYPLLLYINQCLEEAEKRSAGRFV